MDTVDLDFALEILPILMEASIITVEATFIAFAMALVFGLLLAILRRSRNRYISIPVIGFIEFIRSTPLLIQIFFIFYILPDFGIVLPALTAGILAMGTHYSTYTSEVYRAGLDNVDKGQWEAVTALNLSHYRAYRDIILPQAIPPIIPALGNYLVNMFKETPLLSSIAVLELMQTAKIIGAETFRYLEPITIVGILFLILSSTSAVGIRRLDHWLKHRTG